MVYQCKGSHGEVSLQDVPCDSRQHEVQAQDLPAPPAVAPAMTGGQRQLAIWVADGGIVLVLAYIFLNLRHKRGDDYLRWQFGGMVFLLLAYPLLWVLNVPDFCAFFALRCIAVPDSVRAVALALLLYLVPAFVVFRWLVGNLDDLREAYWESEWDWEVDSWVRSLKLGFCVGFLHVIFYGALLFTLTFGPLARLLGT